MFYLTISYFFLRKTPEAFADYARLCYREMGAHVKMWITLNEPNDEMVSYQEGHQMLRAHALAWHAYDQEFRHTQRGQVSKTLALNNSPLKFQIQLLKLCTFLGVSGSAHGLGGTGIFLQPRGRGAGEKGFGFLRWLAGRADLWQWRLSYGNEELAATAQLT